jgi:type I restriction enzyme S subunit
MSFQSYPKYKDSGVEWLGEVPEEWEVKRIRHVATLNPSKSELSHLARNTEVSFLPMEAVGEDGKLNLERTRPISEVDSGYTYFREGDVTIAKITPCYENGKGAVMRGLTNGFGFGTTELTVVRPREIQATSDYLHRLFNSTQFRKLGEAAMYGAGGQKRVPDDFVRDFSVAFPPIGEQNAIATFLDRETAKIDALVAEQENLIALLKEKRQAVISHAVTKGLDPTVPMKDSVIEWLGEVPAHWLVRRIKTISSFTTSGPRGWSERVCEEGCLFIQSGELTDQMDINFDSAQRVQVEDDAEARRTEMLAGDILVCITGAKTGNVAVCRTIPEKAYVNQHLCLIRPDKVVHPCFLGFYLKSKIGQTHFEISQYGLKQGLSLENVREAPTLLPPIREQIDISAFLDTENAKLDELTTEARHTIDLLKDRRAALISAAVTGKIDVRGYHVHSQPIT